MPSAAPTVSCRLERHDRVRRVRNQSIAKAKAAGVYKGRPASIDAERLRELKDQGIGAKIRRASVYRALEDAP
jgi:DNA invertase Pin-like site-specific DNA recombinase